MSFKIWDNQDNLSYLFLSDSGLMAELDSSFYSGLRREIDGVFYFS